MGISPMQIAVIALIVVLLFGTKRLPSLIKDVGESIKGIRKAVDDD